MNISERLCELGMIKLPKTQEINGFIEVVTFVMPEVVRNILTNHFDLQEKPHIVIIRRGKIGKEGRNISRKKEEEKLLYSLAYYNSEVDKFIISSDETGRKAKGILGSMNQLVVSDGCLFTANKYS